MAYSWALFRTSADPDRNRRRHILPVPQQKDDGTEEVENPAVREWKKTESRFDGSFFFLDCPDGEYTLIARDEHSGLEVEQTVHSHQDAMKKGDRKTENRTKGIRSSLF